MAPENFLHAISVLLDRRPFEMFHIELKNGKRLEIDSPIALSARGGVSVFIPPGGNFVIFDHDSVSEVLPSRPNFRQAGQFGLGAPPVGTS